MVSDRYVLRRQLGIQEMCRAQERVLRREPDEMRLTRLLAGFEWDNDTVGRFRRGLKE